MVLATVAVVLPLTATRAINYVDLPAPTPAAPEAPAVPVVAAVQAAPAPAPLAVPAPVAPLAPVAPVAPVKALHIDRNSMIHIDGQQKRWNELSPAEKDEVRRSIAHAKAELAHTRIDREEIQRDIREAMEDAKIDREELKRDLAEAREEIARAIREVDANAVHIRRSGLNPEQLKASIRASLRGIENIDVDAIQRQALASIDHRQIEASIAAAEASIERAQEEVEQIEEQFQDD
jgi:autotransporter translocation and assembly factor TamB